MLLQNDEFRSAPYMSNLELHSKSSFWSNICISIQMLLSFEMILEIKPKKRQKTFFLLMLLIFWNFWNDCIKSSGGASSLHLKIKGCPDPLKMQIFGFYGIFM